MDLASTFAEEARRLDVPTTTTIDGRWWEFDRKAWAFRVSYTWAQGAGFLDLYPTITKKGRLVRIDVPPQTRPLRADSPCGLEEITPFEKDSVGEGLYSYLKQKKPIT